MRLARAWREQLHGAQARLTAAEAIIAAVPDPLILLDAQRRMVRANAAAMDFVGSLSPPRDLAAALRNPMVLAGADAVLCGEANRVVEFTLTVPVERQLRARFARIDPPPPEGAVAMLSLHDITELKRTEQMRADFIANASHELRTPLATLTGFIETLRGPARDDAEARERFLAIMSGQAARMARLVEDLLSLSRIEQNEHVPPQDRVALAPVLDHLAQSLELRAGERNMRLRMALAPDLPDVQGDRDELAQLFQNLFDNAIKYGRLGSEITRHRRDCDAPVAERRIGSVGLRLGCGARSRRGHCARAPAAPDRAFLSRRHRPLARDGRHRARLGDRQAHRQPPSGVYRNRQHPGCRVDFYRVPAAPFGDTGRRQQGFVPKLVIKLQYHCHK